MSMAATIEASDVAIDKGSSDLRWIPVVSLLRLACKQDGCACQPQPQFDYWGSSGKLKRAACAPALSAQLLEDAGHDV